jgi:hypothetical protein
LQAGVLNGGGRKAIAGTWQTKREFDNKNIEGKTEKLVLMPFYLFFNTCLEKIKKYKNYYPSHSRLEDSKLALSRTNSKQAFLFNI